MVSNAMIRAIGVEYEGVAERTHHAQMYDPFQFGHYVAGWLGRFRANISNYLSLKSVIDTKSGRNRRHSDPG